MVEGDVVANVLDVGGRGGVSGLAPTACACVERRRSDDNEGNSHDRPLNVDSTLRACMDLSMARSIPPKATQVLLRVQILARATSPLSGRESSFVTRRSD